MRFTKIEESDEPFNEVTELCEAMVKAFDAVAGDRKVRCIAFVETPEMMGIAIDGFPDQTTAIASLLQYLQGMFAQNGQKLDIGFFDNATAQIRFLDEAEDRP